MAIRFRRGRTPSAAEQNAAASSQAQSLPGLATNASASSQAPSLPVLASQASSSVQAPSLPVLTSQASSSMQAPGSPASDDITLEALLDMSRTTSNLEESWQLPSQADISSELSWEDTEQKSLESILELSLGICPVCLIEIMAPTCTLDFPSIVVCRSQGLEVDIDAWVSRSLQDLTALPSGAHIAHLECFTLAASADSRCPICRMDWAETAPWLRTALVGQKMVLPSARFRPEYDERLFARYEWPDEYHDLEEVDSLPDVTMSEPQTLLQQPPDVTTSELPQPQLWQNWAELPLPNIFDNDGGREGPQDNWVTPPPRHSASLAAEVFQHTQVHSSSQASGSSGTATHSPWQLHNLAPAAASALSQAGNVLVHSAAGLGWQHSVQQNWTISVESSDLFTPSSGTKWQTHWHLDGQTTCDL